MADTTERVRYEFEVVTDSAIKELTDFSDVFESVGSGFKRLGTMTNSLSKSITASTKVFTGFTKAAKAFTGVAIGKGFAEATKEAIDFYETLNLFRVAMKDSIDVGNEFIDHISEWYGLDPKNLMQYTGTIKVVHCILSLRYSGCVTQNFSGSFIHGFVLLCDATLVSKSFNSRSTQVQTVLNHCTRRTTQTRSKVICDSLHIGIE